jgi:Predicted methylated DNA-protein cysteine methyltransferase
MVEGDVGRGAQASASSEPAGDDFASRVLAVVESIPAGKVMSYGDIAAAIGSRAPRGVGQVMAYFGSDVPWWRVIRADGHPPLCHDAEALTHYEREGTPLLWSRAGTFRINLRTARHRP